MDETSCRKEVWSQTWVAHKRLRVADLQWDSLVGDHRKQYVLSLSGGPEEGAPVVHSIRPLKSAIVSSYQPDREPQRRLHATYDRDTCCSDLERRTRESPCIFVLHIFNRDE